MFFITFTYLTKLKVKALILLICFGVYFLDILKTIEVCDRMEQELGCSVDTESCVEMSSCSNLNACNEKESDNSVPEKCPSQTNDCTTICISCPQNYVTVIPACISITLYSFHIKKAFPEYQESLISEFQSKAWKPPIV